MINLLLDNHVNRLAYVLSCVKNAIANVGISLDQLKNGGDAEEMAVIQEYLKVRETYKRGSGKPMTGAKIRAVVTKRYLDDGKISAKKGSFISNSKLRRG